MKGNSIKAIYGRKTISYRLSALAGTPQLVRSSSVNVISSEKNTVKPV